MKSFAQRTTQRRLRNAGLVPDEIRIVSGFAGLRDEQQRALLAQVAHLVIANVQEAQESYVWKCDDPAVTKGR